MKILLTGANGLLGQKIVSALQKKDGIELLATSKGGNRNSLCDSSHYRSLDLTDSSAIQNIFKDFSPEVVINTAAMTNVDACEKDQDACLKNNVDAVSNLAAACEKSNARLIHLSTDFIFDGLRGPYS